MEPNTQSGGINLSQSSVTSQGDLVGRDKIIHNIVIVGQVLDMARVEDLLPQLPDLPDFGSISSALESTINERIGRDLAEPVANAGAILQPFYEKWTPRDSITALLYPTILADIAPFFVGRLMDLNYWFVFCEPLTKAVNLSDPSGRYPTRDEWLSGQIIWLRSLSALWQKYFSDDGAYGLTRNTVQDKTTHHQGESRFIVQTRESEDLGMVDFSSFNFKKSQVFIVGFVIDLIRLSAIVSGERKFWDTMKMATNPGQPSSRA
jgi:hypothetical protein